MRNVAIINLFLFNKYIKKQCNNFIFTYGKLSHRTTDYN